MKLLKAVRGTKDIFGEDAAKYNYIIDTAKEVFEAYGYSMIKTPIFEETFAPPKTAVTGFSLSFKTLLMLSISLAKRFPKHLLFGKNCAIIVVEACALCAVPKASFIKISPNFESCFAK